MSGAKVPAGVEAAPIGPGTVLFGEYEIECVIGEGGMGTVYRARHRAVGELRAIKVIRREFTADPRSQEFFYGEARALKGVDHPAVVKCHELLRDETGRICLLMEYVDGQPLSELLRNVAFSDHDVRALRDRIAAGLAAAHDRGVIHRDLSPDNVLLPKGQPDQAKLIDFGIAKMRTESEGTVFGHVTGFAGKHAWASPEQFGLFGGQVDQRSDLYSLGLLLAYAASGQPLPMGTTMADAVDARRRVPELPQTLPEDLRHDIEWLLAPRPDGRPLSAHDLLRGDGAGTAEEEQPVQQTRSGSKAATSIPRAGREGRTEAPRKRRNSVSNIASAAVLGVALGLGLWIHQNMLRPQPATPASGGPAPATAASATATAPPASSPAPVAAAVAPAPLSAHMSEDFGSDRDRAADPGAADPEPSREAAATSRPESPAVARARVELIVRPEFARVRFDHRLLEDSPNGRYSIDAIAGTHDVEVTAGGGYRSYVQTIGVTPGKLIRLPIELAADGRGSRELPQTRSSAGQQPGRGDAGLGQEASEAMRRTGTGTIRNTEREVGNKINSILHGINKKR